MDGAASHVGQILGDGWIQKFKWRKYLMEEGADMEFDPPYLIFNWLWYLK